MENTSSARFSTGPHPQDHLAVLDRILDSGGLATVIAGLEPTGFLYLEPLQVEVEAMPNANLATLRLSAAVEWYQLAVEYISRPTWRPSWQKMAPSLNI
jgi:hypothetical protein